MTDERMLTEAEVATLLGFHVGTVRRWRSARSGPRYHRFGHEIRYSQGDVAAFIMRNQFPLPQRAELASQPLQTSSER